MLVEPPPRPTPVARILRDDDEALVAARTVAPLIAEDAAHRDRERELPWVLLDELSSSGLLAITVPAELGGADVRPSTVAEVFRTLAVADPNVAQLPHSHFVYVNLLRLAAPPAPRAYFLGEVLAGRRLGNAQSEPGGRTLTDIRTRATPTGDGRVRIEGVKGYCTGALFAHWLPVLARDGAGVDVIAMVPRGAAGLTVEDDWDALGQRTTASGTVRLDGVEVPAAHVFPRAGAFTGPHAYGAFAQLLHAAIDVGIARGALDDAVTFTRTKSRPWFEAGVDRAVDDPLLVQRVGELAVEVRTAEAVLADAGRAVDRAVAVPGEDAAAEASIAVATAKVVADRVAVAMAAAVFEVGGTRSAGRGGNLDRHWRNARTHTLHDPVRWKLQHIGRWTLRGEAPPRHGVI